MLQRDPDLDPRTMPKRELEFPPKRLMALKMLKRSFSPRWGCGLPMVPLGIRLHRQKLEALDPRHAVPMKSEPRAIHPRLPESPSEPHFMLVMRAVRERLLLPWSRLVLHYLSHEPSGRELDCRLERMSG